MAITFDKLNKWVLVGVSDTTTSIQALADAIRTYEAELNNLDIPPIMSAVGKADLGGGLFTGIVLTLLNGWKIKVNGTPGSETQYTINQGDLVTDDATSPTVFGTNVKWEIQQSTSPALVTANTGSTTIVGKRSLDR